MSYLEIVERIEQGGEAASYPVNVPVPSRLSGDLREMAGPLLAVKIGSPMIGDYWLILDDTEPFDSGDGLPVYRPSEIRALASKGYGPEALQAVHRVKAVFDGTIHR
mgnify:CR=1 FL=1